MAEHSIVHVEIPARDQEESSKFYSDLFGWEMQPFPEMNYVGFRAGSGPGGGLPKIDGENTRQGEVVVSVSTDDINASLAKAESLGGAVVTPMTEIPDMGWYAVFADPSGNRVGLYKGREPGA